MWTAWSLPSLSYRTNAMPVLVELSQEVSSKKTLLPLGTIILYGICFWGVHCCGWLFIPMAIVYTKIACGVLFSPLKICSFLAFQIHQSMLPNSSIWLPSNTLLMLTIAAAKFKGRHSTLSANGDINQVTREIGQKNSTCIMNSFSIPHLGHIGLKVLILPFSTCAIAIPPCRPSI